MDPRPIHFEYRRPRHYNPTFQSTHFSQSIFSLRDGPKDKIRTKQRNPEQVSKSFSQPQPAQMKRANSTELSTKKNVGLEMGANRYQSKGQEPKGRSKMASYGNNLVRNSSMQQTQVYKRQQKQFNIINFYPRDYKPNLKVFPKFSLQHRLIQTGRVLPT